MEYVHHERQGNAFLSGNFVGLRAGSLWLVFPQADVKRTQRLERQLHTERSPQFANIFVDKSTSRPSDVPNFYVALSEEMTLLETLPVNRFLLTAFEQSNIYWCWDDVRIMANQRLTCFALPAIVRKKSTLVEWMIDFEDDALGQGFFCQAEGLSRCVIPEKLLQGI